MADDRSKGPRLVAVGLLAALVLGYPFLAVFDGGQLLGVPRVWAYLMAAWLVVIAMVAWIVRDS